MRCEKGERGWRQLRDGTQVMTVFRSGQKGYQDQDEILG